MRDNVACYEMFIDLLLTGNSTSFLFVSFEGYEYFYGDSNDISISTPLRLIIFVLLDLA